MEKKALLLAKKLIRIPSYVGSNCNEIKIAEFVYRYCQTLKGFSVSKQYIKDGRFNVVLKDNYPTKLLFVGHLDTVEPRSGWKTNQFISANSQGRLFGLGAADMKSNIAAFLTALQSIGKTNGIMALFYIDEEYDFAGMRAFVNEYKDKTKPSFILSGDGNDLMLGNGCRGLIELTAIVKGKSAHASNPQLGINAITSSANAIQKLAKYVDKNYQSSTLGTTTCNLAFLQGGLSKGRNKDMLILGREGNNVPDIAEFVIDIRTADPKLNAGKIILLLSSFLNEDKLSIQSIKVRHDFGAWITPKQKLRSVEKIINGVVPIRYTDLGKRGFIDVQLLSKAFPVPCFTLGAGDGKTVHSANENILIRDLFTLTDIYKKIITSVKGVKKNG